jgi:aminomethyltransferase
MDKPPASLAESLETAYNAALESCLVVEHEPPGVLAARGSSTLDLLHRMSTNDMLGLAVGEVRATVLTTAIGRIVDVVQVLRREEDFLLVTSPGMAARVREWLARYIFFNDDVVLSQPIAGYRVWGLYGPAAAAEAADFIGAAAPTESTAASMGESYLWARGATLPGFHFLAGSDWQARAEDRWGSRGQGTPYAQAFEAHRIERGDPAPGHEINDDVIPLEVGLSSLVSFDKGCYIGQEVIARMESRSRIARLLAGLRLEAEVAAPQEILLDGSPIGQLTSNATSPRWGPIGLGLVRSAALESAPRSVRLAPSGVEARLQLLPFDPATA